jgi:hypothetical protein
MVQQISYAQEIKDLREQQEAAYSSSGSDGQPTTSRACNNASDGRGQFETCNQATSSYSGRTTQLHSIGLQL